MKYVIIHTYPNDITEVYEVKVAYVRVSTDDQNTARQEEAMKALGVERIYIEKVSGKNTDRPQLKAMMDFIREGDIVIVESYSRLARSTHDLLELVEFFTTKGVSFRSLKENIDTSTPQGKLMLTIFAGLAQFERECLLQRQAEGIAIAKSQGKYKGRTPAPVPDNWNEVYQLWKSGAITAVEAQKRTGIKPNTFYRLVSRLKET